MISFYIVFDMKLLYQSVSRGKIISDTVFMKFISSIIQEVIWLYKTWL